MTNPIVTREEVLRALDQVIDPVSGRSVVHQDMIQGLVVRDGHAGFALEVPAVRGASAQPLRAACEAAVTAIPGITRVTAVLTAHDGGATGGTQEHAGHKHGHGHGRAPKPAPPPPASATGIKGVNAVIAVASGKGGVGKSTVAVNLALALAARGLKVGLLDADVYGPSLPRLVGVNEKPKNTGRTIHPIEVFGIKTLSIGYLVPGDDAIVWRGPMVMGALTQMLNDADWAPLDVLLIDMPPGTGDAQITIAQRVPLRGAVIVSTPQDIALIDARKGINMFRKTEVPILGVVENMSVYVCPGCGHEDHIFGHGGARATADELGVPFLGEVPLVPRIRALSDAGTPVVMAAPQSREAQAFIDIAGKVAEAIAAPARAAPRIVVE